MSFIPRIYPRIHPRITSFQFCRVSVYTRDCRCSPVDLFNMRDMSAEWDCNATHLQIKSCFHLECNNINDFIKTPFLRHHHQHIHKQNPSQLQKHKQIIYTYLVNYELLNSLHWWITYSNYTNHTGHNNSFQLFPSCSRISRWLDSDRQFTSQQLSTALCLFFHAFVLL